VPVALPARAARRLDRRSQRTGRADRGKSDVRWLEASALEIPIVADPVVYPSIENGVSGLHAALVDDAALRARIGAAARDHVRAHGSSAAVAPQWAAALAAVRDVSRAA
jgi:hypothetical protein